MAERENRYAIVIPKKDFDKLSYGDRAAIGLALDNIERRRILEKKPSFTKNNYIVCNQDEPYAEAVWDLILLGEDWKAGKEVPEFLVEVFQTGDWNILVEYIITLLGQKTEPAAGAVEEFKMPDFEKMTKAQIVEFVANNFNPDDFVLDQNMKKDEMIRAINEYLESPF